MQWIKEKRIRISPRIKRESTLAKHNNKIDQKNHQNSALPGSPGEDGIFLKDCQVPTHDTPPLYE